MNPHRLATLLAAATSITLQALAGTTFVIGSYNVRNRNSGDRTDDPATNKYWDARVDNVARTIRDGGFDILAINELTDDVSADGRTMYSDMLERFQQPDYAFVAELGHPTWRTIHAILYKPTLFEVLDHGSFWHGPDPDNYHTRVWDHGEYGRMSAWAKMRVKATGEIFYVMETHLHHQGNISRNESAAQNVDAMRRIAGGYPAFICGDHNATTSRIPFYNIYSSYFDDARAVAAKTDGSDGTCNVWKEEPADWSRIDYVWVSGATVSEYSTIQEKYDKEFYPSDHIPVRAVVTLLDPPAVRVRYVDGSAAAGGNGTLESPYSDLQAAIDASGRGDTLLVAAGTYRPTLVPEGASTPTFSIGRSLTLIGGYAADFSSIAGRTLLSGDLDGDGAPSTGDAASIVTIASTASVEMSNVEVANANGGANNGAGIQCNGPRLVLDNAYIHDNSSSGSGAGVYAYGQIKARNCTFERNVTTSNGGAIFIESTNAKIAWSMRIDGCTFASNKAKNGAAINVQNTQWLNVLNSSFYDNESTSRGTIIITGKKPYATITVANCTFANNRLTATTASDNANKGGAAIMLYNLKDNEDDGNPKARVSIVSCTIVDNVCQYIDGAEVPDDFNAAAVNCVKGIYLYLNNNIIAGNVAPKATADVYLTVPSCLDSSNSRFNIYSHAGSINGTLHRSDYYAGSSDEAARWLAESLDGTAAEGRFIANLSSDGDGVPPAVRILNPTFGAVQLNSLAANRFNEVNVGADLNGDCQIAEEDSWMFDQCGRPRSAQGAGSYGAYEYSATGAITTVGTDPAPANGDCAVEYYDLRGVKVAPDALAPGIYIRRQGPRAEKILVK